MDDDKLTSLFATFNPRLSSDDKFMERLERNLQTVELVKLQTEKMQRKNRLALIVAAVAGFIAGIISTLCYPYLDAWINSMASSGITAARLLCAYDNALLWAMLSVITALLTYSAYDITLTIAIKSTKFPSRLSC